MNEDIIINHPSYSTLFDIYNKSLTLNDFIQRLNPHDHLCLLYETEDEWRDVVIPFISTGLAKGEKCIYIADEHSADNVREYLNAFGVDVRLFEDSGQLSIKHHSDTYTIDNIFDPDRMIDLFKTETKKALGEGYSGLRATGEMSWALKGIAGSDRLIEYEARLNAELFPHYPCIALCQYNLLKFSTDIIKSVILTHPLLAKGDKIYRNFYYVYPENYFTDMYVKKEIDQWLDNLDKHYELEKAMFLYDKMIKESEKKYHSLFNNAQVGLFRTSLSDGRVLDCNEKMAKIFGFENAKEAIGHIIISNYVDKDARRKLLEILKNQGSVNNYESRFYKKDGSIIWVRFSATIHPDKDWLEGVAEDITDIKAAENELRLQNRLMQSIIKIQSIVLERSEPSIVFHPVLKEILDITESEYGFIGGVLKNNEGVRFIRFYSFAGIKWDEHTKSLYERYLNKDFIDFYNLNTLYGEVVKTAKPVISNDPINDKRGRGIPEGHPNLKSFLGLPLVYGDEIIGIIGIANKSGGYNQSLIDFLQPLLSTCSGVMNTINKEEKRKETLRVLGESEAMLRSIIVNSPNVFYLYHIDKSFEFVSPQLTELLGYKVHEVLTDWRKIASDNPINAEGFKKNLQSIQTGKPQGPYELELIHKNGHKVWVEVRETPVLDKDNVVEIVGSFTNITKRKEAELSLLESENRYKTLFNEAPIGYHEIDTQGLLTMVNKTELAMLGYDAEEMIGQPIWKFRADKEAKSRILSKISGEMPPGKAHERTYIKKDGTELTVLSEDRLILDSEGNIKGLRVTIQDISQLKKVEQEKENLEKQLRQSLKMEAIGQLAGGIAHDFNNILTVITGYCTLSLLRLKEDDPLRKYLEQIDKSAKKAADLTSRLLAFGRKQIMEVKVVDLNSIVNGIRGMLERLIREDIHLTIDTSPEPTEIKADHTQIEQVIINLVTNASDAMPEGGDLIIETSNVYLNEDWTRKHIDVKPGNYVMLSVSDTGTGMSDEVKDKLFEPFFTTKGVGKGTGLGLPMVYGIVKQSGGNIWVYSELGKGTTFKIYFPKASGVITGKQHDEVIISDVRGGRETILVVEDDDVVRELTVDTLKMQGYDVISASNGGEAFLICEQTTKPINLIITDVVMPGMSGKTLINRLKDMCPKVKVIYMSGYTDNAIVHHGVLDEGVVFIQKPFTFETLCKKVRDVLDER